MKDNERVALAIIGTVSLFGGLTAFTGSILSKSFVGYVISSPFAILGIILTYISIKAK